jgi:ribosomal protein L21E
VKNYTDTEIITELKLRRDFFLSKIKALNDCIELFETGKIGQIASVSTPQLFPHNAVRMTPKEVVMKVMTINKTDRIQWALRDLEQECREYSQEYCIGIITHSHYEWNWDLRSVLESLSKSSKIIRIGEPRKYRYFLHKKEAWDTRNRNFSYNVGDKVKFNDSIHNSLAYEEEARSYMGKVGEVIARTSYIPAYITVQFEDGHKVKVNERYLIGAGSDFNFILPITEDLRP